MNDIGLFWQLTIKTIDDLSILGNENLALEMYIIQLVHLKNIENRKDLSANTLEEKSERNPKNLISENKNDENLDSNLSTSVKNQLKNIDQIKDSPLKKLSSKTEKSKIEITSFQNLIEKANTEKEVELKFDLERNVKLVSFSKGKIDIGFNEKLNQGFIKNLTEKLLLWTGERWIISLSKNLNAKSVYEKNMEKQSSNLDQFEKTELAKSVKNAFPDAKLLDIKEEKND